MSKLDLNYEEQVSPFNEVTQVQLSRGTIHQRELSVLIKETWHQNLPEANLAVQEAMHQAKLTHEHIAKIYDCCLEETDEHRIKSLLILEWLGTDVSQEILQRRNSQRWWSETELFYYLRDIVSALAFAEEKGVSHQDVKPENIFIFENTIKLANFGSSKDYLQTKVSYGQGSSCYLSPEYRQAIVEGRRPDCDPYRSDVYSLGLTFLHMTLLEPPPEMMEIDALAEKTREMLGRVQYSTLQQIINWMLIIDPNQRPSFTQVKDYLASVENAQGPECTPQGDPGQVATSVQGDPSSFQQGYDPNSYQSGYPEAAQPVQSVDPAVSQPQNGSGLASALDPSSAARRTSMQFYGNPQGQSECMVCHNAFFATQSWQSLKEGGQLCSYPCRKYYEQNTGTRCAACQGTVTDDSWWGAAFQQYGAEHQDHFRSFCSFQCFASRFPLVKKEPNIVCVACHVQIKPSKTSETKAVQLNCLHSFHDVTCAQRYLSRVSENFSRKVTFVCPVCQTPITEEVLQYVRDAQARMREAEKRKQESARKPDTAQRSSGRFDAPANNYSQCTAPQKPNGRVDAPNMSLCYKCRKEPVSCAFDCGHSFCHQCKKSAWFGLKSKCPICPCDLELK